MFCGGFGVGFDGVQLAQHLLHFFGEVVELAHGAGFRRFWVAGFSWILGLFLVFGFSWVFNLYSVSSRV